MHEMSPTHRQNEKRKKKTVHRKWPIVIVEYTQIFIGGRQLRVLNARCAGSIFKTVCCAQNHGSL